MIENLSSISIAEINEFEKVATIHSGEAIQEFIDRIVKREIDNYVHKNHLVPWEPESEDEHPELNGYEG